MKKNIEKAYEVLDNKIINSNEFARFIAQMIEDRKLESKIKDAFTFNGRYDIKALEESFYDIDFLKELSSVIGNDKEYSKMITEAVMEDNPVLTIINTKFVETKYGNTNKEDLSVIDALFTILEVVFSLDTIIESFEDKNVLISRFNDVMKDNNPDEINRFIYLISKIYHELKDEKDYNKIIENIRNKRSELSKYILAGYEKQVDEVSNDLNSSFEKTDNLFNNVMDIIGRPRDYKI